MGHAIPVRTDYTAGEVRRLAQRAKDAAQARRLLTIAAVLDGALARLVAWIVRRVCPIDVAYRQRGIAALGLHASAAQTTRAGAGGLPPKLCEYNVAWRGL